MLFSPLSLTFLSTFSYLTTAHSGPNLLRVASDNSFANATPIVETSVGAGATETQTFFPTVRPGFANLTSIIHTFTVISVPTGVATYSYDIGPGGVGWTIPTASDGLPILAQPSSLPEESSESGKSSSTALATGSHSVSASSSAIPSSVASSASLFNSTRSENTASSSATITTRQASSALSSSVVSSAPTANSTSFKTTPSSSVTLKTGQATSASNNSISSLAPVANSTSLKTAPSSSISVGTKASGTGASETGIPTSAVNLTTGASSVGSTSLPPSSLIHSSQSTGNATVNTSLGAASTRASTDSFTGSSTQGSAESQRSSTSDGTITGGSVSLTGTVTSVPADFTGITLSGSSLTANGWVTTTDADHHTTLVPFILLGGGRGVALWDLPPIPNVEFELPGLPKFHLPCIKVFGVSVGDCTSDPGTDGPSDDSPSGTKPASKPDSTQPSTQASTKSEKSERSSSQTSTSTSRCSATKTASDCVVSCASSVSGSSCASYATTCTLTTAACSIQGTTTTISDSACLIKPATSWAQATQTICNGKCARATKPGSNVPSFSTSGPNPSPNYRKRAVAGRITVDPIKKRAAESSIESLGGCALATPASQPLTRPGWPSVYNDMLNPEHNGNMAQKYSVVSRYDRATSDGCVFTTTRLDAAGFLNAPNWQDMSGNSFNNINNAASLDHAYEKDWLKQFFNQIISSTNAANTLTCAQMNQYFFKTACQTILVQQVWDELASNDNLKFIAMSQYLNGNAKGMFFPAAGQSFQQSFVHDSTWQIPNNMAGWTWPSNGGGGPPYSAEDALYTMIGYFETVLYGVLEMKTDNMLDLMDRTNNAIYEALLTVDDEVKANTGQIFGNTAAYHATFPNGIAGAYKDFMTKTIEPQITTPPQYLTNLWTNRIGPMLLAAYNLPDVGTRYLADYMQLYNLCTAHNNHYWNGHSYAWEYTFSFSWDINHTKLRKRSSSCASATSASSKASVSAEPTTSLSAPSKNSTSPTTSAFTKSASAAHSSSKASASAEPSTSIVSSKNSTSTATPQSSSIPSTRKSSSTQKPSSSQPVSSQPASKTSTSESGNAASTCVGNQIEGSCTQASLPSSTPDGGTREPVCNKVDAGTPLVRFNKDKASQGASDYCNSLISSKAIISATSASLAPGKVANGAEDGGQIAFAIVFDVDSCDAGTSSADQKVDFKALGHDTCYENLYTAISTACAQDSTWGDYDKDFTLEGGVWGYKCALWSMSGEK